MSATVDRASALPSLAMMSCLPVIPLVVSVDSDDMAVGIQLVDSVENLAPIHPDERQRHHLSPRGADRRGVNLGLHGLVP